ncbi:lipopolysaccharide biosynthesis protein [Salegentibacter sp. BDJ18]|uniref:lipopolysaccharide biosynthesis protein n=1 Tax=Salegentibacter sp. BDJ18 TaxID=2816376 RepID=UPI001AAEECC1|nr:lipopolysaccharide biosynthesis protein [Salegentibacter sp. BDJ18]MBO2542866.1 lipopolysaccharide biosynthesis protein [Salegentibacter sp. BDJ18]
MSKGFKWSAIEKSGQYLVQFLISIILARLLTPEDFGNIAILNVFLILSHTMVDAGFSQALIRKTNCSFKDYNSVFWFNLFIASIIYIVLYSLAPLIGKLFNNQMLTILSRWLFLVIPLGAINIIQITKIIKELNFKILALGTILASVISGIIGVFCAYYGYGIWSLVIQIVLNSIILTIFIWLRTDWKPKFCFSLIPIKEHFSFSLNIFASTFLNNLFNNLYIFVIGKFFTTVQVGYYSQAYRFATQPTLLLDAILTRVTYPVLSSIQDDKIKIKEYYRNLQIRLFVFVIPIMLFLIAVSENLILLILGEKWSPIVPYFQIFCIAAMTFPIHPICISTLKVLGLSKLIFKLELVKKGLMIALLLVTIPLGLKEVVYGQLIFFLITLTINMFFSGREIDYNLIQQLKDIFSFLLISVITFLIFMAISAEINISFLLLDLLLKALLFFSLYIVLLIIVKPSDRSRMFYFSLLKNKFK